MRLRAHTGAIQHLNRKEMDMGLYFDTREYERSHLNTPRGRGSWAFEIYGVAQHDHEMIVKPAGIYSEADPISTVEVLGNGSYRIWTRGSTTYGEAKKAIRKFLTGVDVREIVNVCP